MKQWLLKKIWLPLYGQWALRYTRKTRRYTRAGMRMEVPAGVFHPGLYFSTPVLTDYLKTIVLKNKTVLDMGCGSGMLALFAAKCGAQVTAVDINPEAVAVTQRNAAINALKIAIFESDLFGNIPSDSIFDYMLVNPPYFAAAPRNMAGRAFFAGAQLEYFRDFFSGAAQHLAPGGSILMVLGSGCDMDSISAFAGQAGFHIATLREIPHWGRSITLWQINLNK